MNRTLALVAIMVCAGLSSFETAAQIVGRTVSTTVTHPDGSKEVIEPNGRHSFYNPDGSPRGINKTCSNGGGLIVSCTYWGPNSYGRRR
jgi:hypothetical protein